MGRARGCAWQAVALLAALAMVLAACTGGGRHQPVQAATKPADVTSQAKRASASVVAMARAIRSWRLDPTVRTPLIQELGYVDVALEQGNQLGARALLAAWKVHVQRLAEVGVLGAGDGGQYQSLASKVTGEIPGPGRVTPFTQPGAPPVVQGGQEFKCGSPGYGLSVANMVNTFVPYALGQIPAVGWLVAGLYAMIWTGTSGTLSENQKLETWKCLREEAAKTVAKKYAEFLDRYIVGLQSNIWDYVEYVNHSGGDPEELKGARAHWLDAQKALNTAFPFFKGENPDTNKPEPYAYVYLPEFAQFTNLDLANLRDGVLNGGKIGLTNSDIQTYKGYFTNPANPYGGNIVVNAKSYADKTYAAGLEAAKETVTYRMAEYCPTVACSFKAKDKAAPNIDEFNAANRYEMYMIPAVQEQAFNWPFLDPVKYPGVAQVPPDTRVIWSPAIGWGAKTFKSGKDPEVGDPTGPITPPRTSPGPVTRVTVWTGCKRSLHDAKNMAKYVGPLCEGNDAWVKGWRLSFGGAAPGPLYGYDSGYDNRTERSFTINPAADKLQITSAEGVVGLNYGNPIINSITFVRSNEDVAGRFGNPELAGKRGTSGKREKYNVSIPGEVLANVYSGGNYTGSYHHTWLCKTSLPSRECQMWTYWEAPSSVVFGFRLADSLAPSPTSSIAAYVTNSGANSVSVIDTADNRKTGTIDVGERPSGVAVAPDGRYVYIANSGSNDVSVIDSGKTDSQVAATIPVGKLPGGVAVAPDGKRVYVANSEDSSVSVINTATNKVVGTIHVGHAPGGVAVTPDSKRVYVANGGAYDINGSLSVIDAATNTVVKTIDAGKNNHPRSVAVAPDGAPNAGRAYVAISPTVGNGRIMVIDTATNTEVKTISLGYRYANGVAVARDGQVYVTDADGKVSVIDPATNTVVKDIDVGGNPRAVAVTPDGNHVYVATGQGKVAVIDTATNSMTATFDVGGGLDGIAVSSRPFGG